MDKFIEKHPETLGGLNGLSFEEQMKLAEELSRKEYVEASKTFRDEESEESNISDDIPDLALPPKSENSSENSSRLNFSERNKEFQSDDVEEIEKALKNSLDPGHQVARPERNENPQNLDTTEDEVEKVLKLSMDPEYQVIPIAPIPSDEIPSSSKNLSRKPVENSKPFIKGSSEEDSESDDLNETDDDLRKVLKMSLDPEEQVIPSTSNVQNLPKTRKKQSNFVAFDDDETSDDNDEDFKKVIKMSLETEKQEKEKPPIDITKEELELKKALMLSLNPEEQIVPKNLQRFTLNHNKIGQFRPIVIDGCNLAYNYGKNVKFDAKGLHLAYNHFKDLGFEDDNIVIIIKHVPERYMQPDDQKILGFYKEIGVIHESPSRIAGREIIMSDDDLFILNIAKTIKGNVLSNDRYRQYYDVQNGAYRDVIRYRLIKATFIQDQLILPQDPLGKDGPELDSFLRF